jgi:hypothetical protein
MHTDEELLLMEPRVMDGLYVAGLETCRKVKSGYTCTRPKGHEGMHAAWGYTVLCAVWEGGEEGCNGAR